MISYWYKLVSWFDPSIPTGSKALTLNQLEKLIQISLSSLKIIREQYLDKFPTGKFSVVIVALDKSNIGNRALKILKVAGFEVNVINVKN